MPTRAATVIRRRRGPGFAIAAEHSVLLTDDEFVTFDRLAELTSDAQARTNDGGCDPFGAFVIGTMFYDERPHAGAVYRVTGDGRVSTLYGPVSISNGVQWSGDGTRVYYVDTPTRRVDIFDVDPSTGEWYGRRTHIQIRGPGVPDGMAIDEHDGLWIALWGGSAVNHYDRAGRLVESISIPGVSQISSCAFGGADRSVLYITTSRQGLSVGEEPDAGALFCVQTSVQGATLAEFDG